MTDKQKDCKHEQFEAHTKVGRLTASETDSTVVGYTADTRIRCTQCDLPFEFIGVPNGISFQRPMVSSDFLELRAPIQPFTDSMADRLTVEIRDNNKTEKN